MTRSAATRVILVAVALIVVSCGSGSDAIVTDGPTTSTAIRDVATTTVEVPSSSVATTTSTPTADLSGDECADVVAVDVRPDGAGFTFDVTVASTETGWDKYADAWVVKTQDGVVLDERILTHPHVEEQPFTRSQSGIVIPDDVTRVVVAARDSVLGFCGEEMTVVIDGGTS